MSDSDTRTRPRPPFQGDEAATLVGFLDEQRAILTWKCADLDDGELRRPLPPSEITLGGLLKHLAYVEDYWFTEVVAGAPAPPPWDSVDWNADGDWDWHSAADDTGDQLRAQLATSVQRSRAVVDRALATGGLDGTHAAWGGQAQVSLRWVLTHMVEEYARHNGHADLVRESIDGRTGQR